MNHARLNQQTLVSLPSVCVAITCLVIHSKNSRQRHQAGAQLSSDPRRNALALCRSLLCIYFFLATLGLHCCAWAFSSYSEQGLFITVQWLLLPQSTGYRESRIR